MKILADVNIEESMIRWLVEQGHDLLLARDEYSRSSDSDLLKLAHETGRIILTRDKDYGDLIFRDRSQSVGVVLVRVRGGDQSERLEKFAAFWADIESAPSGSMIVVTNLHLRIKPPLS